MPNRLVALLIGWTLALLGALPASAAAQGSMTDQTPAPPRRSHIPSDAIAWWRLDPSRFQANQANPAAITQRQVLIAGLRAAVASGVIANERAAGALEGLLAASEVGSRVHTLCLLDLDAIRPRTQTGIKPKMLRMILELESGADHAALLRTIRAILIGDKGDPNNNLGAQRELHLPGGVSGVAYQQKNWSTWREISWASTDHSFVIGLGVGALQRWFSAQERAGDEAESTPPWRAHEEYVNDHRPAGDVFFEAYMGLDRVRHGFPEAFISGRVRRVLETLHLSNARDVMVHGRWIEPPADVSHAPLAALDITWSARSERPGVTHGLPISEAKWPPGAITMSPPPGSFLIVMRADWRLWTHTALELASSASPTSTTFRRRAQIDNWLRLNTTDLDRFLSRFEPWVVISDVPTPITPIPGAATFFAELRRGSTASQASAELGELLACQAQRIDTTDGVWAFLADPAGVLHIPAWGFVGATNSPILVGGWGPPVVTENRKRLGDPLAP